LFDAVASIIGLRQMVHFEGQAAMELEFLAAGTSTDERYSFSIGTTGHEIPQEQPDKFMTIDWAPLVREILTDLDRQLQLSFIAAKFHNTLAEIIVAIAQKCNRQRVVLSGGCFQNKYLTEGTVTRLREEGFRPYWHQRVPPNDGGIALGQIYAVLRSEEKDR